MKHIINNKLFSVINAIPNPVIVIKHDKLQSANNAFLEFFNIQSVEEFNKIHDCIAKLFVPNNGFFTLSDDIEDEC